MAFAIAMREREHCQRGAPAPLHVPPISSARPGAAGAGSKRTRSSPEALATQWPTTESTPRSWLARRIRPGARAAPQPSAPRPADAGRGGTPRGRRRSLAARGSRRYGTTSSQKRLKSLSSSGCGPWRNVTCSDSGSPIGSPVSGSSAKVVVNVTVPASRLRVGPPVIEIFSGRPTKVSMKVIVPAVSSMITLELIGPAARTVIDFPVSVAVNRYLNVPVAKNVSSVSFTTSVNRIVAVPGMPHTSSGKVSSTTTVCVGGTAFALPTNVASPRTTRTAIPARTVLGIRSPLRRLRPRCPLHPESLPRFSPGQRPFGQSCESRPRTQRWPRSPRAPLDTALLLSPARSTRSGGVSECCNAR